jgi:hypothetical protein
MNDTLPRLAGNPAGAFFEQGEDMKNPFRAEVKMITGGPLLSKMLKEVIEQEKKNELVGALSHGRDSNWHLIRLPYSLLKQRLERK